MNVISHDFDYLVTSYDTILLLSFSNSDIMQHTHDFS